MQHIIGMTFSSCLSLWFLQVRRNIGVGEWERAAVGWLLPRVTMSGPKSYCKETEQNPILYVKMGGDLEQQEA